MTIAELRNGVYAGPVILEDVVVTAVCQGCGHWDFTVDTLGASAPASGIAVRLAEGTEDDIPRLSEVLTLIGGFASNGPPGTPRADDTILLEASAYSFAVYPDPGAAEVPWLGPDTLGRRVELANTGIPCAEAQADIDGSMSLYVEEADSSTTVSSELCVLDYETFPLRAWVRGVAVPDSLEPWISAERVGDDVGPLLVPAAKLLDSVPTAQLGEVGAVRLQDAVILAKNEDYGGTALGVEGVRGGVVVNEVLSPPVGSTITVDGELFITEQTIGSEQTGVVAVIDSPTGVHSLAALPPVSPWPIDSLEELPGDHSYGLVRIELPGVITRVLASEVGAYVQVDVDGASVGCEIWADAYTGSLPVEGTVLRAVTGVLYPATRPYLLIRSEDDFDLDTRLTCGNGAVDAGEECDDGVDNSDEDPGACRTDCTAAGCGDGVVDSDEACDEGSGNADTADACRTDCTEPACGDGVVDSDEDCDLGSDNSDVTADVCRTDCTDPRCGDGVVDDDEGCDDGNGNGPLPANCSPSCTTQGGEQVCDDYVDNDGDGVAGSYDCADPDCQDEVECTPGATPAGGPCDSHDDCATASGNDPLCFGEAQTFWPGGMCSEWCFEDDDCGPGGVCSSNVCWDHCETDADCEQPATQLCLAPNGFELCVVNACALTDPLLVDDSVAGVAAAVGPNFISTGCNPIAAPEHGAYSVTAAEAGALTASLTADFTPVLVVTETCLTGGCAPPTETGVASCIELQAGETVHLLVESSDAAPAGTFALTTSFAPGGSCGT